MMNIFKYAESRTKEDRRRIWIDVYSSIISEEMKKMIKDSIENFVRCEDRDGFNITMRNGDTAYVKNFSEVIRTCLLGIFSDDYFLGYSKISKIQQDTNFPII